MKAIDTKTAGHNAGLKREPVPATSLTLPLVPNVPVVQGVEYTLEGPQETNRQGHRRGQPKDRVNPKRRRERNLNVKRATYH